MKTILTFCLLLNLLAASACGLDKVTFATNWKAQPEHGGFYQAIADGTYREYGLDVTIKPGGPSINNRPLLAAGRVEFLMGTNLLQAFDAVKQRVPTRVVAAIFQRDPQCLLVHPDAPYTKWEQLPAAPLLMSNSGRYSYFQWMRAAHGFKSKNLRPYNHSLAPFLARKTWVQQGYATAEPMRVEEALARPPRVFLLADYGWSTYSTVIETRNELIASNPGLVKRFVEASLLGWRHYLDGDGAAAAELIKRHNPTMTDRQIAFSRREMRRRGLVDSGAAAEFGVGAIRPERVRQFYATMVEAGVYKPGEIDPDRSYTTRFVNQGVGAAEKVESAAPANAPAT